MQKYIVRCFYDLGDILENYSHVFYADSKTEATEAMQGIYPNADGYKAEICHI